MSFDLWISCWRNGDSCEIPRDLFDTLTGPYVVKRADAWITVDFWKSVPSRERVIDPPPEFKSIDRGAMSGEFKFPDGVTRPVTFANRCDIYVKATGPINGFTVNRPVDDINLYNIVFEVLKQTTSVMYWPDCKRPKIGRADTEPHLHPGLVEALGPPVVAHSAEELRAAIKKYS